MPSLYMNGRNYTGSGSGEGGGNVYGAFIDTNRLLHTQANISSGTVTYTATEDCAVNGVLSNGGYYAIDGETVEYADGATLTYQTIIYLRKGQTLTLEAVRNYNSFKVYGLTFGTQNIFTPQIYSTEERCVGVWIDNKPLYAKTFLITATVITTSGVSIPSIDISGMDDIIRAEGVSNFKQEAPLMAYNSNGLKLTSPQAIEIDNVVLWYTKTTDTAGSGSYNTLGVPMVHYSTDEQVVGTDEDGETIYEKTFKVASPTWSSGSGYSTITVDISSIGTVDKLSFVRGTVYDNTDDRMFNIPYFRVADSESLLYECRVNSDRTPYFVLFVRHSSGAGYSLSNLSVTLQYTKSSS